MSVVFQRPLLGLWAFSLAQRKLAVQAQGPRQWPNLPKVPARSLIEEGTWFLLLIRGKKMRTNRCNATGKLNLAWCFLMYLPTSVLHCPLNNRYLCINLTAVIALPMLQLHVTHTEEWNQLPCSLVHDETNVIMPVCFHILYLHCQRDLGNESSSVGTWHACLFIIFKALSVTSSKSFFAPGRNKQYLNISCWQLLAWCFENCLNYRV